MILRLNPKCDPPKTLKIPSLRTSETIPGRKKKKKKKRWLFSYQTYTLRNGFTEKVCECNRGTGKNIYSANKAVG